MSGSIRIDGMLYGGISNIGCKPTVSEKEQMGIETFVFDYHGDAYGKENEVALYEYVRPEKKIRFCRDASRAGGTGYRIWA